MKRTPLTLILICLLTSCVSPVQPNIADQRPAPIMDLSGESQDFYEAHRHDFDYDRSVPLSIEYGATGRQGNVAAVDLTYASPKGGRVPATLLVPDGKGPFAGMVLLHGMPSNRRAMLPTATLIAQTGAVVITIDAPFARPDNLGRDALTLTGLDRDEQIQLIVDLQRAVDVLLSRPDVDPHRLGYLGISFGGAMGGLFAGVEDRLQAYDLMVGDGGLVIHLTGREDELIGDLFRLPEDQRETWLQAMWPIEPIHFVGHASPAGLLFQSGTVDEMVPAADALRYQEAGSEPKTVLWYESGHGLPRQAMEDSLAWLENYTAPGRLLLLDSNFRPGALIIDRLFLIWLLLTLCSLVILTGNILRRADKRAPKLIVWIPVTLFFGPFTLLAYWLLCRSKRGKDSAPVPSPWQRALAIAPWAVTRSFAGAVLTLVILYALPADLRDAPYVRFPLVLLLPMATSIVLRWLLRRLSRDTVDCRSVERGPLWTEPLVTLSVLVAAYPLVIWLGEVWIARWFPLDSGLSNGATWIVLLLGAWAGVVTAYPVQLWIQQRVCRGPKPDPLSTQG